jgi:hypothetical protein
MSQTPPRCWQIVDPVNEVLLMKNPPLAIEPLSNPTELPGELEDEIRRRAYELYEKRQGVNGSPEEDWLQAEAQVLSVMSKAA